MTHTSRTVPKMIEGSLRRSTAANAMSDGCSATARPRTRAAEGSMIRAIPNINGAARAIIAQFITCSPNRSVWR